MTNEAPHINQKPTLYDLTIIEYHQHKTDNLTYKQWACKLDADFPGKNFLFDCKVIKVPFFLESRIASSFFHDNVSVQLQELFRSKYGIANFVFTVNGIRRLHEIGTGPAMKPLWSIHYMKES